MRKLLTIAGTKPAQAAFNTLAGGAMLWLLFRSVPVSQIAGSARPHAIAPLLALVAMVLIGQGARALRWRWLLQPIASVGFADAFCVNAATQLLNYLVPLRAGEGLRLFWLTRRGAVTGTALGCVMIDHTFDLCGVVAVLGVGLLLRLLGVQQHLPSAPTLALALGGALVLLALLAGTGFGGPALARSRLVPARFRSKLELHAANFQLGIAMAVRGGRLPALFATSAVAVVLDGLAFAMLFVSLGQALPILSAVVAQSALLYAYVLPAAPGYIGSLEAAGTILLSSGFGLSSGSAAGAMVVWHALGAVLVLGIGVVAFLRLRRSGQLAFNLSRLA